MARWLSARRIPGEACGLGCVSLCLITAPARSEAALGGWSCDERWFRAHDPEASTQLPRRARIGYSTMVSRPDGDRGKRAVRRTPSRHEMTAGSRRSPRLASKSTARTWPSDASASRSKARLSASLDASTQGSKQQRIACSTPRSAARTPRARSRRLDSASVIALSKMVPSWLGNRSAARGAEHSADAARTVLGGTTLARVADAAGAGTVRAGAAVVVAAVVEAGASDEGGALVGRLAAEATGSSVRGSGPPQPTEALPKPTIDVTTSADRTMPTTSYSSLRARGVALARQRLAQDVRRGRDRGDEAP